MNACTVTCTTLSDRELCDGRRVVRGLQNSAERFTLMAYEYDAGRARTVALPSSLVCAAKIMEYALLYVQHVPTEAERALHDALFLCTCS